MKNYLIDTHAHIDMLENPIEETFSQMENYNVKKVIIPSVEIATMEKVLLLGQKYDNLYSMLGIFPTEAKTFSKDVEQYIESNIDKIVAIGEVGLDYYWDKSFKDLQKEVFIKQIELANKYELPIVIHDREAHKDTYDILKEYNKSSEVLFHCFSGSVEFMKECVKLGHKIALGGVVTFKNAKTIKEVALEIDLSDLMLETDCPYLAPHPFRGEENSPKYIGFVAKEIAKIKNIPYDSVVIQTAKNAREFFNLEDK